MKIIQSFFFFLFLFALQMGFSQGALEYSGKRIHLSSAKVLSDTKKHIKLSFVVSNTGREDIRLYEDLNMSSVYFSFGETFDDDRLARFKDLILDRLIKQNTLLRAGQLYTPKSFKIKKSAQVTNPRAKDFDISKTKNGDITDVTTSIDEEKSRKEAALEKEKKKLIAKAKKDDARKPKKNKSKILSPIGELPKPEASHECFDLVVDDLVITKTTKRNIYISFNLINYGQGIFKFDRKNQRYENLSVKAFFASIPRLTRGALIAGGDHFDELFDEKSFSLAFGESIAGSIKISLEKMTKFTPVVILELDPFSVIEECDKVNNISTVLKK